jgi:branched-chain amino acid transport system ATP-binding protein
MSVVLEARALSKRFGGITATDNVSIALTHGCRHALIGPNGAGKTTLVNLLTGVLEPSAGAITLNGQDITRLTPEARVARGLVRTFQISQLFDPMTPLEAVTLAATQTAGKGGRFWRKAGTDAGIGRRALELLARFRLTEVMHRPTRELAYGKRRALDIAVALACDPKVLLLDEPAAGVPAGERDELLQSVRDLPSDVSVLLIEHDMDLVFSYATRVTVLVNGALLTEGTPDEIAVDPRVREVYLGHGKGGHAA